MNDAIARQLLDLGYTELFQRTDDRARARLWSNRDALIRLALDSAADPRARFLAAEVVLSNDPRAFNDAQKRELAPVYTRAMRDDFAVSANAWSLPTGTLGPSGSRLLQLGSEAIPALEQLLDDSRNVAYEGSKEAMVARSYGFRVKDLAALFINEIKGMELSPSTSPRERDAAIAALKRSLS